MARRGFLNFYSPIEDLLDFSYLKSDGVFNSSSVFYELVNHIIEEKLKIEPSTVEGVIITAAVVIAQKKHDYYDDYNR
jgi:hypothetical protein